MNDPHKPRQINLSKAKVQRTVRTGQASQIPSAPHAPQQRKAFDVTQDTAPMRVARPQPHAQQSGQRTAQPHAQQSGQRTAQPPQTSAASRPKTAEEYYAAQRAAAAQGSRSAQNSAQGTAAQSRTRTAASAASQRAAQARRKKKNRKKTWLIAISSTLLVLLCLYMGVQIFGKSVINTGDMGTLDKPTIQQTPPEYRGKRLNLLVLGIDYTTEDGDSTIVRDKIGNTDMILYCQFDFEQNTMKMLQIPRDIYVGKVGGSAGKINGVFRNAADPENRVAAVAEVVSQQLNLPVDNYVTIDMDSLREMVDLFGGIEVDIPYDIVDKDKNGKTLSKLEKGPRMLMGAELEFFLRARHMLPRGDIDRLENQRLFYAALFKRLRTATVGDLMKLIPVCAKYVNSDLSVNDLIAVAINVLKINDSNIMMCRLPAYGGAELYNGAHSVIVCAKNESVTLLNQYFFDAEHQITAADLTIADYPTAGGLYDSAVQWMGPHEEPVADSTAQPAAGSTVQPAA